MLNPIDDDRFARALERAKEQIWRDEMAAASERLAGLLESVAAEGHPQHLRRIAVKSSERTTLVKVEEIDWIEASDQYVVLHAGGRSHLARESLNHLESELDPAQFQRIHRSTMVNLERVREIRPEPFGDALVVLECGTSLRLSRSRREQFERALLGHSGR